MSPRLWLVGAAACGALVAHPPALEAQARFETLAYDAVAAVPGLHVFSIRDTRQDVCYTLFMIDAAATGPAARGEATLSLDEAAARRDQRLRELGTDLEKALYAVAPAIPAPNVLRYDWEAQKANGEFERAAIAAEIARLERWLEQIATVPRLAVAGPTSCVAPPRPTPTAPAPRP